MKHRPLQMAVVGLAIIASSCWNSLTAMGHGTAATVTAAKETVTAAKESVEVRYARAYLTLARIDLQRAVEVNQRFAGTYSASLVERLRQNARIAEEQLRQALKGVQGKLHEVHLRQVEAAVAIAELELHQGVAMHERSASTIRPSEIKKLRIIAELARLNLEKARDPANFQPGLPHLQWQLEQLREEVLQLRFRVEKLSTIN